MSKAYDRVESPFLIKTLQLVGLHYHFVDHIKVCVDTSCIRVNVDINGVVDGFFHPERGLCQKCPLSLYLFIICAKVLSSLLYEGENEMGFQWSKG